MREIEIMAGSSIEDVVNRLQQSKGKDVYASFNGHKLYPDTTLDEAYKLITGKSYDEFKQKEKEDRIEYERQEKNMQKVFQTLLNSTLKKQWESLKMRHYKIGMTVSLFVLVISIMEWK